MQPNASIDDFLKYVHRRRFLMVMCGSLATTLGIVVIAIHPQNSGLDVAMGALSIFGVLAVLGGSLASMRLLKEIPEQISLPCRSMELFTYSYSAGPRNLFGFKRILATLDEVGSHERTPAIEFKAVWFTPGIGESTSSPAEVFGGRKHGQAILAFSHNGCVLGRVSRLRS
jgi:hypothetical protein